MRHFEEMLGDLMQKVVVMGTTAESMIEIAVRILFERNLALSDEVWSKEHLINALQVEVDEEAVRLTALLQPVATDVRFLFMASRIGGELERIADQAINITQSARFVLREEPMRSMADLPIMAEVAQNMVRNAVTAMIKRDVALADAVLEEEEKVDAFRDRAFRTLLTEMMADRGSAPAAMSLILISRNLERIGDHATNVAEEVVYWIQGRDIRHKNQQHAEDEERTTATARQNP